MLINSVEKSQYVEKNSIALQQFTLPFDIEPFDEQAAYCYGKIRYDLEKKGQIIGAMDLMIAAHAQALNKVLVTNNEKAFNRVANLTIENWCQCV